MACALFKVNVVIFIAPELGLCHSQREAYLLLSCASSIAFKPQSITEKANWQMIRVEENRRMRGKYIYVRSQLACF